MNMRSRIVIAVCLAASLGCESLFAQISPAVTAIVPQGEPPQFAYNIFSSWANKAVDDQKHSKSVSEWILLGGGGVLSAGALTYALAADPISLAVSGQHLNYGEQWAPVWCMGTTGVSMLLAGTIVALVPIKDYRHIYSDVFEQQEPEVREAMAAAVLKNMADDGKRGRVNGAIFWYAMPVIELSASLVGGLLTGDDRWQSSVAGHLSSLGFGALFGTLNLLQKSEAELRYERYLDVREQYYANKH